MAPGTLAFRRETEGRKDTGGRTGDKAGVRAEKRAKKAPAPRFPLVVLFMRKTGITG
jgi:hypothetical protein